MHSRMASLQRRARDRLRCLISSEVSASQYCNYYTSSNSGGGGSSQQLRRYLLSVYRSSSSTTTLSSTNINSPLFLIRQAQRRRSAPASASASAAFFHSTPQRWFSEEAATAAVATEGEAGGDNEDDGFIDINDLDFAFTPPPPLSKESQKKVDDLFEQILWLDMVELHLLTEVVNERMGFQSDLGGGPVAMGGAAGGAGAGGEEEEQVKTLFEVKLVGFDAKAKIKVIKEVRAISGLGLKEAKELVESAPKVLQKDLKQDKAEELKAQLEAAGAQVEIV